MSHTEQILQSYLLYFVIPAWGLAGFIDYLCHKHTSVETTSGIRESATHMGMMIVSAAPLLVGLFLEINSLAIGLMIACFFIHQSFDVLDFSLARHVRRFMTLEKFIHSYLILVPLAVLSMVILLHWHSFLALFGLGSETADFSIRLKEHHLSWGAIGMVMFIMVVLNAIPYSEELLRCLRVRNRRQSHE